MATTVWKGFISFGLVSVPVRLFSAARYSHIQFHEVHREDGHRVHQQLISSYDNKVVERRDLALGYEADDGKMVIVEPNELRELEPPSSTTMEILQFVKLDQVDPIYFETSYFSVPEEAGRRGYALLLETMEQLKIAAIAKVTLHRRERAVIIRPYQSGLVLHTIYYPNEIREVSGYGRNNPTNLKKQEIAMAEQFAKELIEPFRPEQFHDEYQARVLELIKSKSSGHASPKHPKAKRLAPVIDLMSALKKSLAEKGSRNADKTSRFKRPRKTA